METGTAACSPLRAVSCRLAWHAAAPSVTASCVEVTSVTLSVPHSSWADPATSGVEVYISHRPELAPEERIRGRAGAVTVTVLVSGCGPVSLTSRLVLGPRGHRDLHRPAGRGPVPGAGPAGFGHGHGAVGQQLLPGCPGRGRHLDRHGIGRGSQHRGQLQRDGRRAGRVARIGQAAGHQRHDRDQYGAQHGPPEPDLPVGRRRGAAVRSGTARGGGSFPWTHSIIFTSSPDNSADPETAFSVSPVPGAIGG